MENKILTAVTPQGSLAAIGSATKTFVVVHSVALALTGGALLGVGVYYAANKYLFKKKEKEVIA